MARTDRLTRPRRRAGPQGAVLALSAGLALALHAAVLLGVSPWLRPGTGTSASPGQRLHVALRPDPAPATDTGPIGHGNATGHATTTPDQVDTDAVPAPAGTTGRPGKPATDAANAAAAASAASAPAADAGTSVAGTRAADPMAAAVAGADVDGVPDDQVYLPRRTLTRAPRALAQVLIDYPPGSPNGEFSAELLLYIDETGRVRHVRTRGARLPGGLEIAAREAFYAVPFSPGELDGRPVKSLYPVEVNFSTESPIRQIGPR